MSFQHYNQKIDEKSDSYWNSDIKCFDFSIAKLQKAILYGKNGSMYAIAIQFICDSH